MPLCGLDQEGEPLMKLLRITGRRLAPAVVLGGLMPALVLTPVLPGGGPATAMEVESTLLVEVLADVVEPDDGATLTDISPTVEFGAVGMTGIGVGFELGLVLEPVRDADEDTRIFQDLGAYVETLTATYSLNPLTVRVGRFIPAFGIAVDLAPGIHGADLAEAYELVGRVGAGADLGVPFHRGEIVLSAALFRADRSFLSDSVFTRAGRVEKADGGLSNTDGFESFSLAATAADAFGVPGAVLHAGYLFQAAGQGDTADQNAVVLGAALPLEYGDTSIVPLVEYARAEDSLGIGEGIGMEGAATDYLTLSLGVESGSWAGALVWHYSSLDIPGAGTLDGNRWEISAGLAVTDTLRLDLSYAYADSDDLATSAHQVGVQLTFETGL